MARRPLWTAVFILSVAVLVVAAGAQVVDVAAPASPAPAPGIGVSAGASLSGVGGGVAVVPALSGGLNSPMAAPILAAPAMTPAAAAAPAPSASVPAAPVAPGSAPKAASRAGTASGPSGGSEDSPDGSKLTEIFDGAKSHPEDALSVRIYDSDGGDAAVERLSAAARSADVVQRRRATHVLAETPRRTEAVAHALVAGLEDDDGAVRIYAVEGLKGYGVLPESAVELLIGKLEEARWTGASVYVGEILAKQRSLSDAAVRLLSAAAKSKDAGVRNAAMFVFLKVPQRTPEIARAFASGFDDPDDTVRSYALKGLQRYTDLPESVVEFLIGEFRGARVADAKELLIRQSALSDASVELLSVAATSKNAAVRRTAVYVLQKTPSPTEAVLRVLVAKLSDADGYVREYAYDGLRVHGDLPQPIIDALLGKLGGKRYNRDDDTSYAAEILGNQSTLSDAAVERLAAISGSDSLAARQEATAILQKTPRLAEAIARALIARLGDADDGVLNHAFNGLYAYRGLSQAAIELLMAKLGETNSYAAIIIGRQTDVSDANLKRILAVARSENESVSKRANATEALALVGRKPLEILEALAVLLKEPALGGRAYGGLSRVSDLSDPVIRTLAGYLDDADAQKNEDGETPWDFASKVLKEQDSLPDWVFDAALDSLKKNPAASRADLLFVGNGEVPARVDAELLALLRAATDAGVKLKLARALESRVQAGPLLAALYPNRAGELRNLLPGLDRMPASGFGESAFRNQDECDAILDYLKRAKDDLPSGEYGAMSAGYKSLMEIVPKILLTPAELSFKAGKFGEYGDYGGYLLPYAVPRVLGSPNPRPSAYGYVKGQQPSPAQRRALLASYAAFDDLIDANFKALSLMAKNSGAFTRGAAEAMLREVDRMVMAYPRIGGDKYVSLLVRYPALRDELEGLWKNLPQGALLPPEVARRVTEFEPGAGLSTMRNLHTMVNFLHQEAFKALLSKTAALDAEAVLKTPGNDVSFINLGETPLFNGVQVRNPLFGMLGVRGAPGHARAIFKNDELSYHAKLGVHSVEIHVKLAEPDEGGLLLIRYSEGAHSSGHKSRRAYIASALERMGIPSQKEGGTFLNVSWDKDHGLASKAQLTEVFPRILRLFGNTGNLDLKLGHYDDVEGEKEALSLAGIFAAEGELPFDVFDDPIKASAKYRSFKEVVARDQVRDHLNAELKRLGLAPLPAERPFGQQLIDDSFSAPVREALMRGELVADASGLPRRAGYAPLETLARQVQADVPRALSVAGVLRAVESEAPSFAAIGGVGRLRAERAQWIWGSEGVVVHVLRDPGTSAIAYAQAQGFSDGKLTELGPDELAATLRKHALDVPPSVDAGSIQQKSWERLLKSAPSDIVPRSASGLPASPGRAPALGRAAFRTVGGFEPGGVFIAPYTTPDDLERMRKSAAVVTTGGGLLSHAAITTRELGLPAVILPSARWGRDNEGRPVLELAIEKAGARVPGPNDLILTRGGGRETAIVHEGDLVRVDGRRGVVASYPAKIGETILDAKGRLSRLAADEAKPEAFAAWLHSLDPPAQAEVGRFVLDETLAQDSRPALQSRVFSILAKALDLRGEAAARISAEAASISPEESADDEAGTAALGSRLESLGRLAAAFQIPAPELAALDSSVSALVGRANEKARAEREGRLARAKTLAARVGQLTAEDLPEMRRLLRRVLPGGAKNRAVETLQKKERELAKIKLERLLSARPTVIPLGVLDDDYVPLVGGKSAKLGDHLGRARRGGLRARRGGFDHGGVSAVPAGERVGGQGHGRGRGIGRDPSQDRVGLARGGEGDRGARGSYSKSPALGEARSGEWARPRDRGGA